MSDDQIDGRLRRRPSISDVASQAGVSRAAVSKVIRNAYGVSPTMRLRVETAIDALGYRPRVAARAMRGASFTIGFQLPALDNDFFSQLVGGAAAGLAASGYQLVLAPGPGYLTEAAVLEALVDRQMDGILTIPNQVTADYLDGLAAQVPVVVLGRHDLVPSYDTVTGDDVAGTEAIMDHLMRLGHRRIAHLTIRPPTDRDPHAVRCTAYRRRMEQAGGEPRIVYTESAGLGVYEAVRGLLAERTPPTAIFAGHDTLAIEVLRALADLGRGPDDVSVVGYDDVNLARHPLISLTTVDQSGAQMGATAVELLMERIRGGRATARHHSQHPSLRVRGSSRPVRPS